MRKVKRVETHFEILNAYGGRFRFSKDEYWWQFGLVPGYIDRDDKTIVELLTVEDEDGEYDKVRIFSNVIAVGDLFEDECLIMPFERRLTRCPKCGYIERKKATPPTEGDAE